MAKKVSIPLALCYDFDGTLAPGNMQEREFIPSIGMVKRAFWQEVASLAKSEEADNILIYMKLMLDKAHAAQVQVRKENFAQYGQNIEFFPGVEDWFPRITTYGRESGVRVHHYIISSGIREMIKGTSIAKHFEQVYASSYCYDHHGVAVWPALALNYTTKTQYLFRINKGASHVYDHEKVNQYIPHESRPIPFSNIVFIGDGDTDIPCFRLVKEQGGHSVAVYNSGARAAKSKSDKLKADGRVNFIARADYSEGKPLDLIVKAIIDKLSADNHLRGLAG